MIVAALAMAAAAPSFECSKASTDVERMICADEGLAHLDQAVAFLYRSALTAKIGHVVREQREFLSGRNDCKNEACVIDYYEWRLAELLGSTGLGKSYDSGPHQTLTVLPLADDWYAFSATGLWIGSIELGQVNDAEASGVFKLVNGRGSREPTAEHDCGWKIQRLPRRGWKLENWPGKPGTPCGGVNATVEGEYR